MKFKFIIPFFTLCIVSIFQLPANAGNNKDVPGKITIYSVTGERFILYVNGIKQNTVPLSIVDVNDLKGALAKVNVIFENKTIPPLDKSIMRMAKDCSYEISKNKKGEYVLNMKTAGALGNSNSQISQEISMNDSGLIKPSTQEDKNKTPEIAIKVNTKADKNKAPEEEIKTNTKVDSALDISPPEIKILTPKVTSFQSVEVDDIGQKEIFVSGTAKDLSGVLWINVNGTNISEIKAGGYFSMIIPGTATKLVLQASDTKGNIGMQTYTIGAPNKIAEADVKAKNKKDEKLGTALKVFNKVDEIASNTSVSVTTVNSDGTVKHAGFNEQKMNGPAANAPAPDAATAAMNNAANHGPIVPGTFTFISEDGEKFTVFMDDVKQNETPQSKVEVNNVLTGSLRSKIVFENTAIPAIEKKGMRMWRNYTFIIKKNKKGKYELDTNGKGDLYGR